MQFWNELEGQTLDGRYPLRRLIRSEGRSAWFETATGETQNGRATICVTEALTDADEVAARLKAAQQVRHPNLVTIDLVGQASIEDTVLVYAVMEPIEQSLSDVLQNQALSPDEGREVAEAIVGALTAIHQTGMSHGHVEAASVLATADTVKLRSDCLQASAASQAEDVAGIGTTLFHAFTQRKALTATDAQINRIPSPFAEIIRNSFSRRWTLAQIANALKPTATTTTPVAPVAPVAAPVPSPYTRPAPPPAAPPTTPVPPPAATAADPIAALFEPVAATVAPKEPPVAEQPAAPAPPPPPPPPPAPNPPRTRPVEHSLPLPFQEEEPEPVAKRTPVGLYAGVAVVVLAIIGWLLFRPSSAPAPAPAQTQATAPAPSPAPAPATHKPAAGLSSKPAGSPGHPVWRVVAYTYKNQSLAQNMVSKIRQKHADLKPEIFKPQGKTTVYLVILGGAMDHDQASKMVSKARHDGLPEDTYVQNFSE